ncbi:hypothetical protein TVAG_569400 [Trichomonas vaginalis G3]|uniref:Baseplate structural protein Gp10 C-terminal domain-containing protein n=2 Tax=Trichomonas vaginalis (strain ATCC PRA-98 / G3) TaxID=412133 RepID=A2HCY5_TRIV3|nr:phage tail repeat-like family [Trichomonas vaginalis G3]EAX72732.1 hypothetical protein TVAG_569400 [Trichomonas vaginalis G3]KAI5501902.1 phage tail repeat-like family [Trichomonas vaginalis G3]|eukprot:XP_001285662.1 hypothetical protein [Trichomonas vaginalis G3]
MTDEFLFQDNKNHTVCINPTKETLNEKPINELLLKADVDNKADKEYVDDAIAKEEERANNAYATKEHTHPELADKTYVDNKMSSEVTRAENEYSKKTHIHSISDITNLQETLNRKSAVGHTHSISEITDLNVSLEKKADKNHTHDFFTTVAIESIEGTVEETGGDVLYYKPPNFPQGLTSDDDITTMRNIRCKDVYVMKDEHNIKFTAQDLYDKKADKTELQTLKTEILQTLYPIGSIYTSMNSTRPEVVLGFGTWTQIVDRFLYCANSSKETGGSKTISGENLPAHSHYVRLTTSEAGWHKHRYWDWRGMTKGKGYDVKEDVKFAINCFWDDTQGEGIHSHFVTGYTHPTGQSKEYMPPYMTVYAWYRNA